MDLTHRRQHRPVIGQRLPHTHEDDVVDPTDTAGQFPAGQPAYRIVYLPGDLTGTQITLQPTLPGGTEGAGQTAAGLGRDADGGPAWIAHDDRFDDDSVESPPCGLDGGAVVGQLFTNRNEQYGEERRRDRFPGVGRQVGPVGRVRGQPAKPLVRDLPRPEGGQPQLANLLDASNGVQIHPVG